MVFGVSIRLPANAKSTLESLYEQFDQRLDIVDPIQRVHNFRNAKDREVVGFCAAALAFGRVTSILQSIDALLVVMGDSPAQFVQQFDAAEHRRTIGSITHRWIRGRGLLALLSILQRILLPVVRSKHFLTRDMTPACLILGMLLNHFLVVRLVSILIQFTAVINGVMSHIFFRDRRKVVRVNG